MKVCLRKSERLSQSHYVIDRYYLTRDRQTDWQTDRLTGSQTDMQTDNDRQTVQQTNKGGQVSKETGAASVGVL